MSDSPITPKIRPLPLNPRLQRRPISTPTSAYKSPLLKDVPVDSDNDATEPSGVLQLAKRACGKSRVSLGKSFTSPVVGTPKGITAVQTPTGIRSSYKKRLSSSFRSPLINHSPSNVKTTASVESLEELQKKHEKLQNEIQDLKQQGCDVDQLQWYIDKLHEYNDIKDIAQMVMGRIAEIDCVTVKEVHKQFGVDDDA